MPRVRMLVGIAGSGRDPGEVLDLPADEAQALVARQHAELVRSAPLETPERNTVERAKKGGAARERRQSS